jgi:hypothetical protein
MESLALRAEATGYVHPFKWEDWLRYLLPSLWARNDRPTLMLTGPSTARENFLAQDFATAFPEYRIVPSAMSLGTFRDITAGLELIEREYGRAALPSVLVLGISPRFLAEIPEHRPFTIALERYSRHYGPLVDDRAAFGLSRKGVVAGTADHLRFRLTHQSGRYRSALAWAVTRVLSPGASAWLKQTPPVKVLVHTGVGIELGLDLFVFVDGDLRRLTEQYISPYRYQPVTTPMPPKELAASLDAPRSWWQQVFAWDPDTNAVAIRARAAALIEWTKQRGIELYVVRLPEHSWLRERTDSVRAAHFDALVDSAFGSVSLLDLTCFLPDDEFLDAEHALWPGARKITQRVAGYVKMQHAHSHAGTNGKSRKPQAHQGSREEGESCVRPVKQN